MEHLVGIRREDLSKTGEQRVALTPEIARRILATNVKMIVQPGIEPSSQEKKRAFPDEAYQTIGASIREDLSEAQIIFGLKEIDPKDIIANKTYLLFSHTHKGQEKNKPMLKAFRDKACTLIDYELIRNVAGQRSLTAFTYMAGYAGMTDTLWTLGRRLEEMGIENPFTDIPQAINTEGLDHVKALVKQVGEKIKSQGTPAGLAPLITVFLGMGKTSSGAQEIYDLLPVKELNIKELPGIYGGGSRNQVYKLAIDIPDMFRFLPDSPYARDKSITAEEFTDIYFRTPQHFESNMDRIFPYASVMMNCILWAPRFPRLLTREATKKWYDRDQTLQVIGDITCDPEGAIQFSQETWIDDPVFIYNPESEETNKGFKGEGIAVMAVTNLPCEFAADASSQFSKELYPFLQGIIEADYNADELEKSNLPDEVQRATILWKGEFTSSYDYMSQYI